MTSESGPKRKEDAPVELESQFVLRLPEFAAEELRKALRAGSMNVKDRLSIQLEQDMRHAMIRFDNWIYPAKLVDLPCTIECLKTIDKKTFYKTADICQMLVFHDEEEPQASEEEEKKKMDKKELMKAEKKYMWPHGITPPLKNVRKRRFRKTLKKKYADAPEIEKEVKRLFRVDNEAVHVKWEIVTEEDEQKMKAMDAHGAESLLFGEVVSSSDDEGDVNILDSGDEDASRLSSSVMAEDQEARGGLQTEFTPGMLGESSEYIPSEELKEDVLEEEDEEEDVLGMKRDEELSLEEEDQLTAALHNAGIIKDDIKVDDPEALLERLEDLRQQLVEIQARRQAQELEIASIENQALKQRLQSVLESLLQEEAEKQRQYNQLTSYFQQ